MSLVDLGKRLLESAKRGDTDDVRTLMSNGAPFTTDWLGTSPLHFSAQFGHISTAEVLLRAGISRDARTKVDRTPLHVAAQEGHMEIVNLLLQHAADIDAKDMLKMTPLHWATEKGHMTVVEVLLKAGADVNCENKFDKTPLDIAIINGRPDIVQTIQLAQHTAVGSLQEPTETVTVETSEVGGETAIIEGADQIALEGHTITTDTDDGNLLLQNMRQIKPETSEDSAEEGNSTSVLATLAALAEATAQNNNTNTNTTEAINWLESQGITMITTSDGNIITSAVESGQTITLTEAGKIALNIIKQQGLTDDEVLTEMQEDKEVDDKVITYVTEGTDMPVEDGGLQIQSVTTIEEADGSQTVITQVDQDEVDESETVIQEQHLEEEEHEEGADDDNGEPAIKMARLSEQPDTITVAALSGDPGEMGVVEGLVEQPGALTVAGLVEEAGDGIAVETTEIDVDAMLQKSTEAEVEGEIGAGDGGAESVSDQEKLRRELEEIKRQAEEFKQQLKQKDKDLQEYKKQLGEISDKSDEPEKS